MSIIPLNGPSAACPAAILPLELWERILEMAENLQASEVCKFFRDANKHFLENSWNKAVTFASTRPTYWLSREINHIEQDRCKGNRTSHLAYRRLLSLFGETAYIPWPSLLEKIELSSREALMIEWPSLQVSLLKWLDRLSNGLQTNSQQDIAAINRARAELAIADTSEQREAWIENYVASPTSPLRVLATSFFIGERSGDPPRDIMLPPQFLNALLYREIERHRQFQTIITCSTIGKRTIIILPGTRRSFEGKTIGFMSPLGKTFTVSTLPGADRWGWSPDKIPTLFAILPEAHPDHGYVMEGPAPIDPAEQLAANQARAIEAQRRRQRKKIACVTLLALGALISIGIFAALTRNILNPFVPISSLRKGGLLTFSLFSILWDRFMDKEGGGNGKTLIEIGFRMCPHVIALSCLSGSFPLLLLFKIYHAFRAIKSLCPLMCSALDWIQDENEKFELSVCYGWTLVE